MSLAAINGCLTFDPALLEGRQVDAHECHDTFERNTFLVSRQNHHDERSDIS
jgi:hypothetical protein